MSRGHIYFLGIGGTLMGSLAQLAREMGYRVSGSDKAVYPPMSDQLAAAEIEVFEGFDPAQLDPLPITTRSGAGSSWAGSTRRRTWW